MAKSKANNEGDKIPSLHEGGVVDTTTETNDATPCACVEVVKAFAALPLEQRLAVHKAIDQAVAIDKERAGLGQDSNTELYDQAIAALNQ
jgi:hypothetical protein